MISLQSPQDNNHTNGVVDVENFSLQELHDFVQKILCATEETKRTLQLECEEARYALKPWPIETTVVRQLDKNTCTCEVELTSEARAEEIAAEIGKTLMHSQQLREKLAANLHKERQNSRKPDIREIYASKRAQQQQQQPLRESNNVQQGNNVRNARRSVSQQRPPAVPANEANKRRSSSSVRANRSSSAMRGRDENLPNGSRGNLLAQSKPKGPTNFILANKLSVRGTSCKARSRSQVDLSGVGGSSRPKPTCEKSTVTTPTSPETEDFDSFTELDRLIKKFSDAASIDSSNARSNCPIHAENAATTIEEKVVTLVDAVDGLDRFGVPSQLVKILKTYHNYVKTEVYCEEKVNEKGDEAADKFLENFERISKRQRSTHLSQYQDVLSNYSSIYQDSYKSKLNNRDMKVLKSKFIEAESLYTDLNIKSTAGEIRITRSKAGEFENSLKFDMKNWVSNGVWNYLCVPELKGIFGTHCTRYSDRTQLMLFYEFIQRVQKKVYENELIELIMLTIIPKLKTLFDPDSREYIEIYKMIVTVVQMLNLQVPVLACTES